MQSGLPNEGYCAFPALDAQFGALTVQWKEVLSILLGHTITDKSEVTEFIPFKHSQVCFPLLLIT